MRVGGDLDIPVKNTKKLAEMKNDFEEFGDESCLEESEEDSDNQSLEESEENESLKYYNSVKRSKSNSKSEREERIKEEQEWVQQANKDQFYAKDLNDGEKRAATWKILKNRGLTPKRKKENRNPRVKRRNKYETAVKRLKDFRRVAVDKSKIGHYAGESTGIKSNLARSVRL